MSTNVLILYVQAEEELETMRIRRSELEAKSQVTICVGSTGKSGHCDQIITTGESEHRYKIMRSLLLDYPVTTTR